jgi:hypothetical protein
MPLFSMHLRALKFTLTAAMMLAQAPEVMSVELKPPTIDAYNRYVQATEARVKKEMARPGEFLYIDGLPVSRRAQILQQLKQGGVFMDHLDTLDASGHAMEAPNALIHHWIGDIFVPHATVKDAVELAQDYNHHQDVYKPELIRSKLLSHDGDDFKIYYRLRKRKVITVTLNSDHDVRYFPVDAEHEYSRSASTRIAEVVDAGQSGEHEKPVGQDGGFLWRIDSWWRWEERDGGVYVECESVSLTRDIPTGLGWLISPFVTSIPKESLQNTMGSTRAALLKMVASRKQ